jgi:hypothetical protein
MRAAIATLLTILMCILMMGCDEKSSNTTGNGPPDFTGLKWSIHTPSPFSYVQYRTGDPDPSFSIRVEAGVRPVTLTNITIVCSNAGVIDEIRLFGGNQSLQDLVTISPVSFQNTVPMALSLSAHEVYYIILRAKFIGPPLSPLVSVGILNIGTETAAYYTDTADQLLDTADPDTDEMIGPNGAGSTFDQLLSPNWQLVDDKFSVQIDPGSPTGSQGGADGTSRLLAFIRFTANGDPLAGGPQEVFISHLCMNLVGTAQVDNVELRGPNDGYTSAIATSGVYQHSLISGMSGTLSSDYRYVQTTHLFQWSGVDNTVPYGGSLVLELWGNVYAVTDVDVPTQSLSVFIHAQGAPTFEGYTGMSDVLAFDNGDPTINASSNRLNIAQSPDGAVTSSLTPMLFTGSSQMPDPGPAAMIYARVMLSSTIWTCFNQPVDADIILSGDWAADGNVDSGNFNHGLASNWVEVFGPWFYAGGDVPALFDYTPLNSIITGADGVPVGSTSLTDAASEIVASN